PGLATDARANDRVPLTCTACQNLPIAQSEPTVAVDRSNILVGWNDYESACGLQSGSNYGYSTDGGVTFVDGNGFPPNDAGTTLYGDPAHAVNHKTANFYVSGLNGGVGCVRGHFATAGFLIDINRQVVSRSPESFLDKPWMTVD